MGSLVDLADPLRILPNPVSRFYRGGAQLGVFRHDPVATDGTEPEDWVGSVTRAYDPRDERPDEGLGFVTADGRPVRLVDVLEADPEGVAGAELVARAGVTTALLVKLLDTAMRLPVHCHPDRAFARRVLGSAFGKAECWIVLATRELSGEDVPHVRLGFRRDVGRGELLDWIGSQDTTNLLDAMHRLEVSPGEVLFIPPGLPHAIGAGIFMVEIQEPTDFSIVAERHGFPIQEADAHLGVGWETMVDAFDRGVMTHAALRSLRQTPTVVRSDPGHREYRLIGPAGDPYFRASRHVVGGTLTFESEPGFAIVIVTSGRGTIRGRNADEPITAGDAFAIPARAGAHAAIRSHGQLELIVCRPPRPERLPRATTGR